MNIYFSTHRCKRILIGFLILALLLVQAAPALAQTEESEVLVETESSATELADAQGAQMVEAVLMPQVAVDVAADVLYYHQDITGNLVAKTDASGEVVWRSNFRPFGQGMPTSPEHQLRFAGQPQEVDIGDQGGLYHLGARYYDPLSGRFMNPDPLSLSNVPIDNPQHFNRYAYGLNNPYRYEDPSGLQPDEVIAGPSPRASMEYLRRIANDPHQRPDVRRGAQSLVQQLEHGLETLRRSPDNVSRRQIRGAFEAIEDARNVVAQAHVSRRALLETLENLGESLRSRGGGGRGGSVITVVFILMALPSIAEAATDEKYGSMVAEVLNLLRPPDFILPLSPTIETHYDPATGQIVSTDLLTWLGQIVDSWTSDE